MHEYRQELIPAKPMTSRVVPLTRMIVLCGLTRTEDRRERSPLSCAVPWQCSLAHLEDSWSVRVRERVRESERGREKEKGWNEEGERGERRGRREEGERGRGRRRVTETGRGNAVARTPTSNMSVKGGGVYERREKEGNSPYASVLTTVGSVASFLRRPCD